MTERRTGERRRKVSDKLACPACQHPVSAVLPDGRMGTDDDGTERIYRRLRECANCHTRYTTVERIERILKRPAA